MDDQDILKALSEAKKSKDRKFKQSVDLVVNLKNIDFNIPANKIDLKVLLPEGRGRPLKIGVFGDADFLKKAAGADFKLTEADLAKEMREIKKLSTDIDFFIAQTNLMVNIGKTWGRALGPRGKMPMPLPPAADPSAMIKRLKNTVTLKSKGKTPNTLHCSFGTQGMDDAKLLANFKAVLNALLEKLPNDLQNIKSAYLKTTMGPSVKIL